MMLDEFSFRLICSCTWNRKTFVHESLMHTDIIVLSVLWSAQLKNAKWIVIKTIERSLLKRAFPKAMNQKMHTKPFMFYLNSTGIINQDWKCCDNECDVKKDQTQTQMHYPIYKLFPLSFFSCHWASNAVNATLLYGDLVFCNIEIIAMSSDNTLQWYNVSPFVRGLKVKWDFCWASTNGRRWRNNNQLKRKIIYKKKEKRNRNSILYQAEK